MTQSLLEKTEINEPKQSTRPVRSWFWIGLEFLVVLIFGLLLLEPILNFAGVANDEVLDLDQATGWTLMPNRTYTYRKEGYSQSTINSHGMRDIERSVVKPAHTYRIAVVGCSLTEGNQVPIKDTYCSVLERKLNTLNPEKHFEVLNFAVSAYTLGQEYLRLKHLAMSFHPDLVIFTVRPNALLYMGPDKKAGFHNSRPLFGVMPDGRLIEDRNFQKHWLTTGEGKRMQSTRWLRYNSRLWGVVGKCNASVSEFSASINRKMRAFIKHPFASPVPAVAVASSVDGPVARNKSLQNAQVYLGTIADRVIEEANNLSKGENSKFILAYMPANKKYRDASEELIIKEIARKHSIAYCDLNQSFDKLEKTTDKPFYVVVHPSKAGHEQLAEQLYIYLKTNSLLR